MKEASGEANMTVITILLIAVVAAIATPLIKNMMEGAREKSECLERSGVWDAKNSRCVE